MNAATTTVPPLAAGVTLLGEYPGTGFTEPHYLAVRGDQQVVQLSRLLYLVAAHLEGADDLDEVAARVSDAYGRRLGADAVRFLLTTKLAPTGLVGGPDPSPSTTASVAAPRANPLLAIRFRGTLLPPAVVRVLARVLAPLFAAPVVVAGLLALVVADVWLVREASLTGAYDRLLLDPPILLAVVGILLLATLVHELGHAAACHHGGAEPGAIGVALYVVYPVFFTDVTRSYRLGRAGRVRTDLGGVYLNALTVVALAVVYARTGSAAVLLAVLLVHVEAVQQLLPLGRLDGYFVVADLVGVPDLFGRIGPILRGLLPGAPVHPRVAELRRSARVVVTVWVLVVGPVMLALLALLLWNLPSMTIQVAGATVREWALLQQALVDDDAAAAVLALLSLVLLPLPLLGAGVLLAGVARRTVPVLLRRPPAPATTTTATTTTREIP